METLKFLQVGAVCTLPSVAVGDGLCSQSTDGRQEMTIVAAAWLVGAEVFRTGLSVESQRQRTTRKNGIAGQKAGTFLAMSVAGLTTAIKDARKLDLEKERAAKDYTITETDVVTRQDWHTATMAKVVALAPGVCCIKVIAKCSQEFVKLEKAYRNPGKLVEVRIGKE